MRWPDTGTPSRIVCTTAGIEHRHFHAVSLVGGPRQIGTLLTALTSAPPDLPVLRSFRATARSCGPCVP
ncbi:hypothetical protein T03_734 [Trichinella britovi]|uniref:Uncharacterized protein n=1 Tax=Trichinella britovi TaxID=45882 RepID=A0A0V0YWU6_TRIBR|nr:hypothetical protein T03_734 [Trichinella britovi]